MEQIFLGLSEAISQAMPQTWTPLLESSALILGLINGSILLRYYVTDKPKLVLNPVHPEIYQWWFRLPGRTLDDGTQTRRFGFLTYIGIANKGRRPVTAMERRLFIQPNLLKRPLELKATNIPEPQITFSENGHVKILPVFGQKGSYFDGNTRIESGDSIAGVAYYYYEVFGSDRWNPKMNDGVIKARLKVTDAFGKTVNCRILFKEHELDKIEEMVPGISSII